MVKWLIKALTAFFVYRVTVLLTGHVTCAVTALLFFWFHPVAFEIQLFSTDPLLALLLLVFLYLVWWRQKNQSDGNFDIARLSRRRYVSLVGVWILLLGTKEIVLGFGLLALIVFGVQAGKRWSSWIRLAPLCGFFIAVFYRIWDLSSDKSVHYDLSEWARRVWSHILLLVPFDPGVVWFYFLALPGF